MLGWLRPFLAKLWKAPAKGLLRLGVTPNAVTVFGSIGAVAAALWFFPKGGSNLFWGTLVIAVFTFTDMLDGTMARLSGKASRFGAFLDSTLDRVVDATIFGSLAWGLIDVDRVTALAAFVCLAVGSFVPYARAPSPPTGASCAPRTPPTTGATSSSRAANPATRSSTCTPTTRGT